MEDIAIQAQREIAEMQESLATAAVELEKAIKGNKSACTRVRKELLFVNQMAKETRKTISNLKATL